MDSFSLWLEFGTWDSVPQYEGDDIEIVRTEWLYGKQTPANKRLMDSQRKEDESYLLNLKGSIERSGFKQPIIVLPNYVIDDGLHRLIVAMDLGLEDVPVKVKA